MAEEWHRERALMDFCAQREAVAKS
jgi:hypothetical protein